jgi:hypothetical protein
LLIVHVFDRYIGALFFFFLKSVLHNIKIKIILSILCFELFIYIYIYIYIFVKKQKITLKNVAS